MRVGWPYGEHLATSSFLLRPLALISIVCLPLTVMLCLYHLPILSFRLIGIFYLPLSPLVHIFFYLLYPILMPPKVAVPGQG